MHISLLTPKIFNSRVSQRREDSYSSNTVVQSNLSSLATDTVSFSGTVDKVTQKLVQEVKRSGNTILDHLGAHYEMVETPRLERLANNYLNASYTASEKLKSRGFSYDMEYNMQQPVKSRSSYESKIERSKSFKVYDTIRDTTYCIDPYDMGNINALLTEMFDSGYILAKVDMPLEKLMKRGYVPTPEELKSGVTHISVPDIDFRLDTETLDLESMPENLRYFVSGKLPSGLEDIQMRFIRPCDIGKPNPVYHEKLIMFGPHSTAAKHIEHRDVYQWVRKFDEIEAPLDETSIMTHAGKAKKYMSLIKEMFRGKVSQKLFLNAKNKDTLEMFDSIEIFFGENDIKLFEGYFSGLRDRVASVYSALRKETPTANFMKARDMKRIQEVYEGLANTINYYNSKAGMPLVEIKKPAN